MQERLKDADSAKFLRVIAREKLDDPSDVTVCGKVNSKNSYGAYAGYTVFHASTLGKVLPGQWIAIAIDSAATGIADVVCRSYGMPQY